MIVTIANVTDFDQFLATFSTIGAEKRKQHGCKAPTSSAIPMTPAGCGCSSTGR